MNRREVIGMIRELAGIMYQNNTNSASRIRQQDSRFELTASFKVTKSVQKLLQHEHSVISEVNRSRFWTRHGTQRQEALKIQHIWRHRDTEG